MVIDRALGNTRAGSDAVHAGGVEAGGEEFLNGRGDHGGAFAIGQAKGLGAGVHQ
jgi:hypothetical protein